MSRIRWNRPWAYNRISFCKSPFIIIVVVLSFSACKVMSPKAYQLMLHQEDSLAKGWRAAQIKNNNLQDELARLKEDTASLGRKLKGLAENLSLRTYETQRLTVDLKKREERLKEVENILKKREEASNQLKERLQDALLGFRDSGLTIQMKEGKVYVSLMDKLLFPTASITIDQKGEEALAELAKVLKAQPDINVAVEGHTDNQKVRSLGQIKDNWDLSVLRATSVVRYLAEVENISPTRLTATGKGEFTPIDTADTPVARSMNRRIEIVLSPKLDELYQLLKE